MIIIALIEKHFKCIWEFHHSRNGSEIKNAVTGKISVEVLQCLTEMHMHRSDAFSEFALPVGEVGFAERQVDGLPVVIVKAQTNARCLADGREACTRELDEEFVFVLVGTVCVRNRTRRVLGHGLHLPCGTVCVEDDVRQELRLVIAIVSEREGRALEAAFARVGCLKVDVRVCGEAACTSMIDLVGVGETEDADEDEEQGDNDDELTEQVLHGAPPFDAFIISWYYNIGESTLSAVDENGIQEGMKWR